jgi:hypothetical protein
MEAAADCLHCSGLFIRTHSYIYRQTTRCKQHIYSGFRMALPEIKRHKAAMFNYAVKSVLNGPFIKRNFFVNGNIFRSRDYHNIPWLNGNLASAEKCSGPLGFRLRQVLVYFINAMYGKHKGVETRFNSRKATHFRVKFSIQKRINWSVQKYNFIPSEIWTIK